jgi:hypothetical protein
VVRLLVLAALATLGALAASSPAHAGSTELFPRVTYERSVEFTPHGPVVLHVVRGPRPVGLYRLRPVLSNESVVRRETVSAMERRLAAQATSVGVNGDYFSFADGRPSGMLLRDGVLVAEPNSGRSTAGITLDGLLDVQRVRFLGTWRTTGERRSISSVNAPPGANKISLFTAEWGSSTPRIPGAYAVVLAPFPAAVPNADLTATVVGTAQGGPVALSADTAVLVARGPAAATLEAEAAVGSSVTVRLALRPEWPTVGDAIGGGPLLVREGSPVHDADEAFRWSQLVPRAPRTAVGQRANGEVLLVTTDGRQPGYSVGMTNLELAHALVRLGAVRAMALDSGGSSTLAFEGTVLNSPSDGRERPVSTALMLQYYGVFAAPPHEPVLSPNGDGVADVQKLSFKVVLPSTVTVSLTAPDGTLAARETGSREPGTYAVAFPPATPAEPLREGRQASPPAEPATPAEGGWTLTVSSSDDQGLTSSIVRRFVVNSTVGFLRVSPRRLVLTRAAGAANAPIRWDQTREARVKVTVETREGVVLRTVSRATRKPGTQLAAWNGRAKNGKLAASGRYLVRVTATNELGTVSLARPLTVRLHAGPKR